MKKAPIKPGIAWVVSQLGHPLSLTLFSLFMVCGMRYLCIHPFFSEVFQKKIDQVHHVCFPRHQIYLFIPIKVDQKEDFKSHIGFIFGLSQHQPTTKRRPQAAYKLQKLTLSKSHEQSPTPPEELIQIISNAYLEKFQQPLPSPESLGEKMVRALNNQIITALSNPENVVEVKSQMSWYLFKKKNATPQGLEDELEGLLFYQPADLSPLLKEKGWLLVDEASHLDTEYTYLQVALETI